MLKKLGALSLVLLSAACASNTDFERTTADLHELQRSNFELKKEVETLKEKVSGSVREETFSAMKESQSDLFLKVNETSRELQELRGRFDENRYFTEKTQKESLAERDLLRVQVAGLEAQIKAMREKLAGLDAPARPKEPEKAASEQPQKTEPVSSGSQTAAAPDARTKAYDAAYQQYKDRKYKEAREQFEAFIKDFTENDLTDNAYFWIAESYYSEKDFESAILAYETLLKKYPDSDKAIGGLLKQGFAFSETGDLKTGRIILKRLIEKYPDSKEAELAKKKIAELEKKPPKKR